MPTELTDEVLKEDMGVIGPIELKFVGRWDRVEGALAGLPHGPVRYRWSTDSTGDLALFIEVPLQDDPTAETVMEYRDRLRDSLNELEGDRPVYIHFVDSATVPPPDA